MTWHPSVLIRADANLEIGSGHVMRCAALGMRLMARGVKVHFVCVDLPPRLAVTLRDMRFSVTAIRADDIADWRADLAATTVIAGLIGHIDWLIVDQYQLGSAWESGMRPHVRRILVIDDLADRSHDCDLLLDQNLHYDAKGRYAPLVPHGTIQYLGPQYALLRPEFDQPGLQRSRDGSVKRLLVFFGGTDPGNRTIKVIEALRALGSFAPECMIVLGPAHPCRDEIHNSVVGLPKVRVIDATDQMATLMAHADLAIGTCGVAGWERCAIGLPCLVVVTAENQREDAEILHRLGAVMHLGNADEVSASQWEDAIRQAMDDPDRICAMGLAAEKVMAGRQAALAELERTLIDGID